MTRIDQPAPAGGGTVVPANSGAAETNMLALMMQPGAGKIFEIGADAFEARDSTPPVDGTPGRVWFYRGVGGAGARDNLTKAINGVVDEALIAYPAGGLQESFRAVVPPGFMGIAIASADAPGGTPVPSTAGVACSSDVGGPDGWIAATCYGGEAAESDLFGHCRITITAAMAFRGHVWVTFPFQPDDVGAFDTTAAATIALTISGYAVKLRLGGAGEPAENDVVNIYARATP